MTLTRTLGLSEKKYDEICDKVYADYPNACVLWVEEINNQYLTDKYEKFKVELKEKRGEVIEKQLFHGTKEKFVNSIIQNGFLISENKICAYGRGTYLSPLCKISLGYVDIGRSEVSYIFLCDVALGVPCCAGSGAFIDTENYDYSINTRTKPTIYSIPYDDAINPRYVIAFHKNAK